MKFIHLVCCYIHRCLQKIKCSFYMNVHGIFGATTAFLKTTGSWSGEWGLFVWVCLSWPVERLTIIWFWSRDRASCQTMIVLWWCKFSNPLSVLLAFPLLYIPYMQYFYYSVIFHDQMGMKGYIMPFIYTFVYSIYTVSIPFTNPYTHTNTVIFVH